MEKNSSILDEVIRRVLSVASPEKIILFGSSVTGKTGKDSDIDLLVVERNPADRRRESVKIDKALGGLGRPFDVIVVSSEYFNSTKDIIGGIAYPANKYGKVLYEAS